MVAAVAALGGGPGVAGEPRVLVRGHVPRAHVPRLAHRQQVVHVPACNTRTLQPAALGGSLPFANQTVALRSLLT